MDNLAHSLVGLASAKAGLERLSPYATTACVLSANAADADFVVLFFGDRWTLLEHHRGITHSIVGTIGMGLLVPLVVFAIEQVAARWRKRSPRSRLSSLMLASLIAAATHPLLDLTNNYGLRPLLPWSGRWFYGDLVFVIDPYIWLAIGGSVFLVTSNTRPKTIAWLVLGVAVSALILLARTRPGPGAGLPIGALAIWITGIGLLIGVRALKLHKHTGRSIVLGALTALVMYWGALALMHRAANANAVSIASNDAARRNEQVLKLATMPTLANPFRWQSVVETDRAVYRFLGGVSNDAYQATGRQDRFEKPTGQAAHLVSLAERDRRAQVLLGFARFPIARLNADNCLGQALVQFADLRYTEPGASRGNFSVNIPVDCPVPDSPVKP